MHIYRQRHIQAAIHKGIHTHMQATIHTHKPTHKHTHIQSCIHKHIHTYIMQTSVRQPQLYTGHTGRYTDV